MAADLTLVTEVATALGTLGWDDLDEVLRLRPAAMANLTPGDWDRLSELRKSGECEEKFAAGFANGRAFLDAPDGLGGRRPRLVEWTGGRRPPGDEVVPSDLRIDHVYLVSCKYLSKILHNPSPARLVEGLLTQAPVDDNSDWYHRVAPDHYQALYRECREALDEPLRHGADGPLPEIAGEMTTAQRKALARLLKSGWPGGAAERYRELCDAVAERTAEAWQVRVGKHNAEAMLWRLLRIGSAPYFILGASAAGSMRLRIATPWDWHQAFRLRRLRIFPQRGGQPRVGWAAEYRDAATGEDRTVAGHVEIRWSHGRFAQPPEAKVYLDTRHEEVPGYHPLEPMDLSLDLDRL